MPVGSEGVVAGQYTVTYGGVSVGIFEGEAGYPSILFVPQSKPINRTDKYGHLKIDSLRLGEDYQFEGVLIEYAKGIVALNPYGAFGTQGTPGIFKYSLAAALVLTAIAGTSAAASPATITAAKAILADGHQAKLVYGPDLRVVPIKMDLLPYILAGSTVGNFVQT